jgi:hypothetical protein
MAEKQIIAPEKKQAGRIRRFVRRKLPWAGAGAVLAVAGIMALNSGTALDNKVKAWHAQLGFSHGCDTETYARVLREVRAEQGRLMESGKVEGMEKLFDVERAAVEIYNSDMRDPRCAKGKDAGR